MRKIPRKPCPYCGKNPKRSGIIYCSIACRAKDWKEKGIHYGGPKTRFTLPRRCNFCKKEYKPGHRRQKYCSRHCMGLARRDEFIAMTKTKTGPRNLSSESRRKMSLAAARRNAEREYTKGIGGIRPDIGHYVRSRWEANVARVLKTSQIQYLFEKVHFILEKPNGQPLVYTPDFKINSWYIEVKGWWDGKSQLKKELMRRQYPEVVIYYIDEQEYINFEKEFGGQIDNWERKTRRK